MMTARQQGVSLLEALVALVVMAVGAVAVVGMQATLRLNGDVAKQRSEATRLAQEKIEDWRGFRQLTAVTGQTDWTDLVSTSTPTQHLGSNTTFSRSLTVVQNGASNDDPLSKTVHVSVSWSDRAGQPQVVTLNTIIAGITPELGGALSLPTDGSIIRNPLGRHPAVPQSATDQGDGTSRFSPPGAGSAYWIFSNATGLILRTCPPSPATCDPDSTAVPLSGFIRFSTGSAQPTAAMAEAPTSSAFSVQVVVDQDVPIDQDVPCFQEVSSTFVSYFCAVPTNLVSAKWSGRSSVAGLTLATSIADPNPAAFRVCRYTSVRSNSAVVPTDLANEDHPLAYVQAGTPLVNQNFLIIRAGAGGVPFVCPDDDTSTSKVNGGTWHHQPAS